MLQSKREANIQGRGASGNPLSWGFWNAPKAIGLTDMLPSTPSLSEYSLLPLVPLGTLPNQPVDFLTHKRHQWQEIPPRHHIGLH